MPASIAAVHDRLLKQPKGDRAFVEVLLALRRHGTEPVEVACALTLERGAVSAPIVLNHLHRLLAPVRPPIELQVPTALKLTHEPKLIAEAMTACGRPPLLADMTAFLKALHLYGMAAALAELDAEHPRQPPGPEIWVQRLIEAKTVDRQARSLRYQMHVARFSIHSDSPISTGHCRRCHSPRSNSWPVASSWLKRIT